MQYLKLKFLAALFLTSILSSTVTFAGIGGTPASIEASSGRFDTLYGKKVVVTPYKLFVSTVPSISSGFGTSPTIGGNGTASFSVGVGTGGTASSGSITMPAATGSWNCSIMPEGAAIANQLTKITTKGPTSLTVTNYTVSTGATVAWPASTVLDFICWGQ